ncbi:MAG: threonine ammonia-lyase [Acidobacteriota bacterium]
MSHIDMNRVDMIDLDEIRTAAAAIADEAVATPVLRSDELDTLAGTTVLAKDESQQRTGSFKFRGAFNRVSAIPLAERHLGVVAVSSGNHGAAVACAAEILGIEATVHVPADVAPAKRALIEGFGARIVTFDRATPDREAVARQQVATTGATFVHPFEDRLVMAGQGTTALELHEQVGALDVLVVPMSGGGLMAGCGSAMRQLSPGCELIGVEPAAADDTRRSFAAGHPVSIAQPDTIADGLAITAPGERTFEINRHLVADVVTVTDDQLVAAMRLGATLLGRRFEPSGVAGLAAVLDTPDRWRGRRVGVVLTGGNIDSARFDDLTSTT